MDHPYKNFENKKEWEIIKKALIALEKNKDLKITTSLNYVIGYLCNELSKVNES